MSSILRTAHGNNSKALLVAERPPIDELPPLNAGDTEEGEALAAGRRNGGTPGSPFKPGNKMAAGRKPSLCLLGVPVTTSDPRYRSALRKANTYRQVRIRELATQHGGHLGAGPSAMLASSARALASSILLNELGAEALAAGTAKAIRNASGLLALAARLADSSRQQELTAVALAEREGKVRSEARSSETPDWLLAKPTAAAPQSAAEKRGAPTSRSASSSVGYDAAASLSASEAEDDLTHVSLASDAEGEDDEGDAP